MSSIPAQAASGSALPLVHRLSVPGDLAALALVGVLVLGAALRLYDLGTESYWLDEVIMLRAGEGDIGTIVLGGRPPVYVLLTHVWVALFGTSEASTRLLPALFGMLSIWLTYVLGRKLFDTRVGLVAALLMSVSAFQIYYSQEIRYYSLFTLCALLSFLLMLRALETRGVNFALYALSGVLMFYSHGYAVFVLAAQNLYFALNLRRFRPLLLPWVGSMVMIGLAISPTLAIQANRVVTGDAAVMKWIPDPPLSQPFIDVLGYIVPLYSSSKVSLMVVPFLAVAALGVTALVRGAGQWWASVRQVAVDLKHRVTNDRDKLLLLGCWLVCPIIIPLALSKVFGPMYLSRYTISATPAFYLLVALLVAGIRRIVPLYVSLALLLVLVTPGLVQYYTQPIKGEWREAAAYIQQQGRSGDILMTQAAEDFVLSWYGADSGMSRCVTDAQLSAGMARDSRVRQEVIAWLTDNPRVWLATSSADDPYLQLFLSGEVPGLRMLERRALAGITTYLFSQEQP